MFTHIVMFRKKYSNQKIKEINLLSPLYIVINTLMKILGKPESDYRSIFENATVGMFRANLQGEYITVNPMLAKIYGYKNPSEVITSIRNIKTQLYVDSNQHTKLLDLLHRKKVADQFESQVYQQDGKVIWISEKIAPNYDSQGNLVGYEGIVEDITQRKQSEIEMQIALANAKEICDLKTNFVSMVSHEFRASLSVILASSDLLKLHSPRMSDEQKIKYFNKIGSTVKNMAQMLEEVLLIGKAESGERNFKVESIDLQRFCQEMLQDIVAITENTHNLVFTNDGNGVTLIAEETLLRQMLMNLLLNAVKYSPKGSKVEFNISCQNEQIIFKIKDQGIGIDELDQKNLFDVFHRGENIGKVSGTGLGLAIVKRAVELHNGEITLESKVGVGTTFTVTLPLVYTAVNG